MSTWCEGGGGASKGFQGAKGRSVGIRFPKLSARSSGPAAARPPLPPSLPYKVDTSRPSLRTNWTRRAGVLVFGSLLAEVQDAVGKMVRPARGARPRVSAGGRLAQAQGHFPFGS